MGGTPVFAFGYDSTRLWDQRRKVGQTHQPKHTLRYHPAPSGRKAGLGPFWRFHARRCYNNTHVTQGLRGFSTLAKAYSQDTSTRENGGDLGFFPRGILVAPEVEEVAFALQPGQFSGVVYSVLGYHIVQVVERDPARQISQENLSLLQEGAVQAWVERLWAQAEVERFVETAP